MGKPTNVDSLKIFMYISLTIYPKNFIFLAQAGKNVLSLEGRHFENPH